MVATIRKKEKNYPLTGVGRKIDDFDVTPEIHYNRDGRAVKVTTYCVVNRYSLAVSDYALTDKGYTESYFDEHHGIAGRPQVVPRSRLEELDSNNTRSIPLLRVLGSDRASIERILREKNLSDYHVSVAA